MLIETIHGPMEESVLERRTGGAEDNLRRESWVEYWFEGVCVHRSARIDFKTGLGMGLTPGMFGR